MKKKALYLAGGGARGAYQAGVLHALSLILNVKTVPFDVISGVSVGSINAAVLAENPLDFPAAVEKLVGLWSEINSSKIYHASNYSLSKSVLRNIGNLVIKKGQSGYILDTSPLKEFIFESINFEKVSENIKNNYLGTLEVISNCYETQQTVSFYHHHNLNFENWNYPRHISQPVELQMQHILASSALPLFFPSVKINNFHYGDGSMGLISPLRGAIRFQVEKILVIGTRQLPLFASHNQIDNIQDIGFAHILGGMLNGVFLDHLDRDIEMVNRMNEIARLLSMWKKRRSPWRPLQILHLRPSGNIASNAQSHYNNVSALLRFVLNVLGAKSSSGDLLSFLLFEKEFTKELIHLGREDTLAARESVLTFFEN